jgi:hypothetical protein
MSVRSVVTGGDGEVGVQSKPDPTELEGVVAWHCLAASSARFASIASQWDDKDGTTKFDVSSSLPDAVSTCLE